MTFWTAVVVIVAIGALSAMYRARLKVDRRKSEELVEDLARRIDRLEDRMASLETIILDREKGKAFRDL
jgi:hypothetical protein